MSLFTRIGAPLWNWEPFTRLDDGPRNLWLALYTTAEAKRIIPGLWHGSIHLMAEASHRTFEGTVKNLDALLDAEGSFGQPMVEYDDKHRVLRMTELPDAGEYPDSPTILKSWWSRFLLVPACQIRDAHVTQIRWILEQGAKLVKKNRTGRPTPAHEEEWAQTFGTIPVPAPRRRGVRRVLDADTGNDVQPSLFGTRSLPSPTPSEASSAISPTTKPDLNDLTVPDTVSRRYGEGEGVGVGVFRSGEGDPRSGSGVHASTHRGSDPGPAAIENAHRRPALALVPAFTAEQLVAGIVSGMGNGFLRVAQTVRQALGDALRVTIRCLDDRGWGGDEVALAGKWLASSHGRHQLRQISTGCPPDEIVCVWAASPPDVIAAITSMAQQEREGQERSAFLASLTGAIPA